MRIVRRAMALRADDRYPTADALARDLERFAAGRHILGAAGAWRRSAAALVRDRPRALVAAAAVACSRVSRCSGGTGRRTRRAPRSRWNGRSSRCSASAPAPSWNSTPTAARANAQIVVALPQQAPLALAPGRCALIARAAGHDALGLVASARSTCRPARSS